MSINIYIIYYLIINTKIKNVVFLYENSINYTYIYL